MRECARLDEHSIPDRVRVCLSIMPKRCVLHSIKFLCDFLHTPTTLVAGRR